MKKQFVILTDRPIRLDQAFQTEGGLWAVCSLPANNAETALKLCQGREYWVGGITKAVEGEFVWSYGRVVGLKLVK